jgi:hypothetical protein
MKVTQIIKKQLLRTPNRVVPRLALSSKNDSISLMPTKTRSALRVVMIGAMVGTVLLPVVSQAADYSLAQLERSAAQQRQVTMQRALSRKIPFSEVTINRLLTTDAGAHIYEPQLYIRFNDHGVTMQASQVQLERILQDLCWQGGFDLDTRLPLSELASVTMHNASLGRVLSSLLKEYSYVLTREADGMVSKLVVMARDETTFGEELIQEVVSREPDVPALTLPTYLAQKDINVRRDLLRSQAGDTSEQAIVFLMSIVVVEPEIAIRRQALGILGQHPSDSVVPALADLAADSQEPLRLEAAQHLMRRDHVQAVQVLGHMAQADMDRQVRAQALALLDQIPSNAAKMIWVSTIEEKPGHYGVPVSPPRPRAMLIE